MIFVRVAWPIKSLHKTMLADTIEREDKVLKHPRRSLVAKALARLGYGD